jgi:hypothetical protein
VRSEGLTELVGDLVLVCNGGIPTPSNTPVPTADFTLFLNTNGTSRLLADPWSEALLLLDEPGTGQNPTRAPCDEEDGTCGATGNGIGGPPNYYVGQGTGQNKNIFQATRMAPNALRWEDVPFDHPGEFNSRTLRFTNVRIDASAIQPGPGAGPSQAVAFISLSGLSIPVNNPQQVVASVEDGLEISLLAPDGALPHQPPVLPQCFNSQLGSEVGRVRFAERFPTALRRRTTGTTSFDPTASLDQTTPGFFYGTESGFFASAMTGHPSRGALGQAGLAQWGTRLELLVSGVPAGVRLFVDRRIQSPSGIDVALLTESVGGAFAAVPASSDGPPGTAEIPLSGGSGSAVWELVETGSASLGTLDARVLAVFPPGTAQTGTARVSARIAPVNGAGTASSAGVPRFANQPTPESDLFSIAACPSPPPPPGADGLAPVVSRFTLFPASFPAAPRGPSVARRFGTRVSYRLSEPATTTFTVQRASVGRRVGRRCRRPTARNRSARRCTRYTRVRGSFRHAGATGDNRLRFRGRLARRRLRPGRYRLVAQARDAASNRSLPRRARFRIVP